MNTLKDDNLARSIGKRRLKFLSNPGYRAYRNNNWVAMYVPQFNQIWTNPFLPKSAKNKALIEEFCHYNTSRVRPMQLLPIINWLDGKLVRPDTDDFRDIAEAIVIAVQPLIKDVPVDKKHLPRSNKYKSFAYQIIDLAKKFSKSVDKNVDNIEARKRALWAIITCLYYVIPLRPNQCPRILAFMEQIQLSKQWKTSHDLFELLIGKIANYLQEHERTKIGFTISKPNDVHMLIFNLFLIMDCIDPQQHRVEVISSIFPACLYLLTLGNSCLVPIYWLKKKKHKIVLAVEIWHDTHEMLRITEESMDLVFSHPHYSPSCGAREAYYKVFQEVKKYFMQPIPFDPYDLFENMLNTVPAILSEYLYDRRKENHCYYCNAVFFNDMKTMRMVDKFIFTSDSLKSLLIMSSRYYKDWLLKGSIDQIDYYLRKDFNNKLPIQRIHFTPDAVKAKRAQLPWLEIVQDKYS